MKPNQQTLPGLPDYREPLTVESQRLPQALTEAAGAGFEPIRMECLKHNTGYKITFQRMPDASECRGARPVESSIESMALSSSNHKHPVNTGDCEEKLSSKLLPPHPSNGDPTLPRVSMTQPNTLLA